MTTDLTPVYPQPPTAEQAAWLADPPPGDWLTLLAADRVPAFMWEGIDREWLPLDTWKRAAALGSRWMPRPTIEALTLTFPCSICHVAAGEACAGRRTHKVRTSRGIRLWNSAVFGGPWPEHREPGRCYVGAVRSEHR